MKKIILFALLCVCAISARAIENAKCYLEHEGNVTSFEASAIADAIEAAVKGDVIYLGEGQYPGFTLNKEITVRGAGADKTYVKSSVSIQIPGSPTLNQNTLVGLGINGDIALDKPMTSCCIKQCTANSFNVNSDNYDILIDNCNIKSYLYLYNYIKSLKAINSKIYQLQSYYSYSQTTTTSTNVCTFVNCNFNLLYNYSTGYIKGTFINCVVYNYGNTNSFGSCIFTNTLFGFFPYIVSTASMQECYTDKNFTMENAECSYDTDALTTKGYLGNDGTVVGIYGGTNPYTLDLSLPRISTSKIALDRENKVLNVNLKVTSH